ncbi:hypothetical protein [Gemmatimonas sp.]|uniref:hypothetical protein n=1 Tax=Gemmatimonas sp. TaxID=1962908 RepID=UPI002ED9D7E1
MRPPHDEQSSDDDVLRAPSRRSMRMLFAQVLAAVVITLVLVPIVAIGTSRPTRTFDLDRIGARLTALDSLRDWRLDAALAPALVVPAHGVPALRDSLTVALQQLGAVQPILPNRRRETSAASRPWNSLAPDAGMFSGLRSAQYRGPNPSMIIARAREGFTSAELSYLGAMAQAPLWTDFEQLTRLSPALGLMQPIVPIGDSARVPMPALLAFGDARQLAIASIYRAAWSLAMRDSLGAEQSLRRALTVGFSIIDVGTGALDALAGATLVDMARDGLQQLRAPDSPAAMMDRTAMARPRMAFIESMMNQTAGTPTHQLRRELNEAIADSTLPRTLRLQALQSLVLTNCDEVRTALLGASDDMQATVQAARRSMSHVPGDSAFFDAIDASLAQGPATPPLATPTGPSSPTAADQVFGAVGDAVAWATRTPRIGRCTRRALQTR